ELVEHSVDLHGGDGRPGDGRKERPSERVSERISESGLERLDHELRPRGRDRLFGDLLASDDEHVLYLLGGGSSISAPPLFPPAAGERRPRALPNLRYELDAPPLPGPAPVVGN